MVAGGDFGWPKIVFKMAACGHFESPIWRISDDRKSLSIAFLAISDQYTTFRFQNICSKFFKFVFQNGGRRLFWMSDLRQKQ